MNNKVPRKKNKSTKKFKKKGEAWLTEDVQVHTGLPPQVEGQLRCFLRLSVNQILWLIPSTPDVTHVRVQWWGETGEGALFRPVDVKKSDKVVSRTTARYAVRSGPKQFAAYLTDLGSLVLEVLSGPLMLPVGRAQIDQISVLSPRNPFNGFFPVFSPNSEKIAELQVSVMLESLMASYDSSGSIPTTDMSVEALANEAGPEQQPRMQPMAHHTSVPSSLDELLLSHRSAQKQMKKARPASASSAGSGRTTPKGVDNLIFSKQTKGKSKKEDQKFVRMNGMTNGLSQELLATSKDTLALTDISTSDIDGKQYKQVKIADPAPLSNQGLQLNPGSEPGSNLLSALLDRGTKLREAMIISTLESADKSTTEPVQQNATEPPLLDSVSSGNLFREILSTDNQVPVKSDSGKMTFDMDGFNTEGRAVDLVLGNDITGKEFQMLRTLAGSPTSSTSSVLELDSDPGDPVHDDSILQELFYRNEFSEDSELNDFLTDEEENQKLNQSDSTLLSLQEPGNVRPPSRGSISSLPDEDKPTNKQKSKKVKSKSKKTDKKTSSSEGHLKVKEKANKVKARRQDDDNASIASNSSRVSFDMTPSDAEEQSALERSIPESTVDGLSVERLTLLGRVHVARVVIDKLILTSHGIDVTPTKKKSKPKTKGKPPRPSPKPARKASTYFVEYQFPVVASNRDKYTPSTMATEVMRVASKRVADGVVGFSHRSVFPVLFDGTSLEQWWKSVLVFKLYAKNTPNKSPVLLGTCSVPLKSVLKSEALYLDKSLDVKDRSVARADTSITSVDGIVGTLKISIELASDSKDFSTVLARTRLAEMRNPKIVPIPQVKPNPSLPNPQVTSKSAVHNGIAAAQTTHTETQSVNIEQLNPPQPTLHYPAPHSYPQPAAPPFQPHPGISPHQAPSQVHQQPLSQPWDMPPEPITFHTLLMIPEGRGITLQPAPSLQKMINKQNSPASTSGWVGRDMNTRNLYLVCRMFWCSDVTRSDICWGTTEPQFSFVQVAPVLMTPSLLERMRNNFMVVEVWDKKTTSQNDQLVGLVKLSLHQFYMSFRDRKIANSLLKSQYPVVSVDNYFPVVNPLSGAQFGQIKVLLAMGSSEQVSSLQRLKIEGSTAVAVPQRPSHYLERQHLDQSERQHIQSEESLVEHVFELSVEGMRGLQLLENMIWGEADCFVQYHFPAQQQTKQPGAQTVIHAAPTLKSYRTATTLCIPDPTFHEVTRHRITLPTGCPVQREILTACAGAGGGSGGVPFEVWCRYYYPNIRDQVIAKASLPLAKLCAMVTMQKRGEPSVQTFALSLQQVAPNVEADSPEQRAKMSQSGLLDVTINYKCNTLRVDAEKHPDGAAHSLPGAQVCVAVSLIRASGLKTAAEVLARHDSGMQYAAEVGVNTYIRVILSFLKKEDERVTRTIARTFCPEFSYHLDFPCPLLWTDPETDALSLAEILETAEATFEIWHQVPGLHSDLDGQYVYTGSSEVRGRVMVSNSGDVLLGTTTVPLLGLLTHKTGISGWYPVNMPSLGWDHSNISTEHHGQRGLERVGGGLEMSIRFAHHEDLERVLHAARGVGWSPDYDPHDMDWQDADDCGFQHFEVTPAVDLACFPVSNALVIGHNKLDSSARCYVRYKFYDKAAICSKLHTLEVNEDRYVVTELKHAKALHVAGSAPFSWYLREERLEIQVWVTYHHDSDPEVKHPKHRDKLIGSAYIDMPSLADTRRRQHRVSGVYPLYKPGAASLGGACIRAHITLKPAVGDDVQDSSDEEECRVTSAKTPKKPGHSSEVAMATAAEQEDESLSAEMLESTFPVHVIIERAMHLPHVKLTQNDGLCAPSCYVSYQSAEKVAPLCTNIFPSSHCPVWSYEHDTRMMNDMLTDSSKNLVFKVWHKPGDISQPPDKSVDKVLGFVSVDLAPLASGFQQICGWYNIIDFNGQCQGQIKVSVTPHEPLMNIQKPATPSGSGQTAATSSSFHSLGLFTNLGNLPNALAQISQVTAGLSHFEQHYQNVKKYHESINQETHQRESQAAGPSHWQPQLGSLSLNGDDVSKSVLLNNLRSNLQELDQLNQKFNSRLTNQGLVENVETDREDEEKHSLSGSLTNSSNTAQHTSCKMPDELNSNYNDDKHSDIPAQSMESDYHKTFFQNNAVHENHKNFELPVPLLVETFSGQSGNNVLTNENFSVAHLSVSEEKQNGDNIRVNGCLADSNLEHSLVDVNNDFPRSSEMDARDTDYRDIFDTNKYLIGAELHDEGHYDLHFNDHWHEGQGRFSESDEDDDADGEVVIPRPLNDISSVNFSNSADVAPVAMTNVETSLIEKDSWFDGDSDNSSVKSEDHEELITSSRSIDRKKKTNRKLYFQSNDWLSDSDEEKEFVREQFNPNQETAYVRQQVKAYSEAVDNGSVVTDSDKEAGMSLHEDLREHERPCSPTQLTKTPSPRQQETNSPRQNTKTPSPRQQDLITMMSDDDEISDSIDRKEIGLTTMPQNQTTNKNESESVVKEYESEEEEGASEQAVITEDVSTHREVDNALTGVHLYEEAAVSRKSSHSSPPSHQERNNTSDRDFFDELVSVEIEKEPSHSDPLVLATALPSGGDLLTPEAFVTHVTAEMSSEATQQVAPKVDSYLDLGQEEGHVTTEEYEDSPRSSGSSKENHYPNTQPKIQSGANLPNFFLPPSDLENSMRALRMATALYPPADHRKNIDPVRQSEKAEAAHDYLTRLEKKSENASKKKVKNMAQAVRSRPLPTAEETKRIAKIFAARFTNTE